MSENFKRKILGVLLLIGGLIIIAIIVYFVFYNKKVSSDVVNISDVKINTETVNPVKIPKITTPVKTITNKKPEKIIFNKQEVQERDIKKMAASFAERFGSYSNQSNFSNILSLKIFMSNQMQKWSENYIKIQKRKNIDSSIYYGIVTKSITEELISLDEDFGQAVVEVKTRRREATMNTGNTSKIFNQGVTISFVKENEAWKVNSANWENIK